MKAGFSRLDITPPLGTKLAGYFHLRPAEGITTPLYANAVAFSDDEGDTAVIVTLDILELMMRDTDPIRDLIVERTGLDRDKIMICCTHTHLGPDVSGMLFEPDRVYNEIFYKKICDAVVLAIADLKDAVAYTAKGKAEGISFIRLFRLKDGGTKTHATADDPEVMCPVGEPDETLGLVKFVRQGASDIAIVNFQTHPDVVGKLNFNYDWPGYVREFLENALCDVADGRGVKAICINGTQGDVNHVDRFEKKERKHGIDRAKHMARVIVGNVLGMYTYADEVRTDKVFGRQKRIMVDTILPTEKEIELSYKVVEIFGDGTKPERVALAESDLELKDIAVAKRHIRMEHEPPILPLDVTCIGIGDIAFVGFPGEPFCDIGRKTKENSPFAMTMVSCCANGSEGYFATENVFTSGGYESATARFVQGTAEKLRDTAIELTHEIYG